MFGFAPFHFRHAVGHHACGGLHIQHLVFDDAGANGNGQIHIPRKAQVTTRAAIQAALGGLELVDQLHGVHLGRARERARRECGFEHIHAGALVTLCVIGQNAFHIAHDVHDVAVALDHKCLGHFHTANLGDAANVVARQVDQHHMLGTLFGVVDQLHFSRLVGFRRGAAWPRARQRADGDFLSLGRGLLPHQNFGRGPHHMRIAQVVVIHIRAGVQRTQGAIQRQRAGREFFVNALPHLHLHEVARSDQLFGTHHRGQVVVFGKAALGGVAHALGNRGSLCGCFQALFQFTQTRLRFGIRIGLCRVGVHHERELAREVVDHRQLFGLQQQDVGHAQVVSRARMRQLLFDVTHRVVAKIARQATTKTWQPFAQGHLETLLVIGHKVQRIACMGFDHHAIGHHLGFGLLAKTRGTQQGARRQTNEAVAPKALAAHHRLEQKAALAVVLHLRQLEVERERGFEISKRLGHQGDAVVALLGQLFEFGFSHVSLHSSAPYRLGRSFGQVLSSKCVPQRGHGISGPERAFEQAQSLAYARAKLPGHDNL